VGFIEFLTISCRRSYERGRSPKECCPWNTTSGSNTTLVNLSPLYAAARASRDLATVVPAACGTVWTVIRAQQVQGAGRHVAVYWDNQINLEVGVEVAAPFPGHGEVVGSATPAGPVVTTTHYGPYSRLYEAHEAIRRWCASNGHSLAGPNWEVYGHWEDEWNSDPTKIRTDVFYLLTAGGA
jgi:effector-binding domain-containing protein